MFLEGQFCFRPDEIRFDKILCDAQHTSNRMSGADENQTAESWIFHISDIGDISLISDENDLFCTCQI
jgi:hypothetical protein